MIFYKKHKFRNVTKISSRDKKEGPCLEPLASLPKEFG